MNFYEEKQEAKRERLRKRAEKYRAEAASRYKKGTTALDAIPFGQPILVGHYSERGDRAYRGKAIRSIEKSFELADKANELAKRANSVNESISSDDPDAMVKLEDKLLKLQEAHALMVERNKEARANGLEKPYAAYQLTNSNANIRRITQRIKSLKYTRSAPPLEAKQGEGWTLYEDKEANRIVIRFVEKVSPEMVKSLRSYAFLWSPLRKEWVCKTNKPQFVFDRVYQMLINLPH